MAKGVKTGGRQKGTPNKATASVKAALAAAYEEIGGDLALAEWATENKTQFYQLWVKQLPLQVNGAGENGEHVLKHVSITFVDAPARED